MNKKNLGIFGLAGCGLVIGLSATAVQGCAGDLAAQCGLVCDEMAFIEGKANVSDSSGEDVYYLRLSDNRADAVKDYLKEKGIKAGRIETKGYGETQPLDSNDTDAGRAKNRRVEVAIYANKKMQKMAEKGQLGE